MSGIPTWVFLVLFTTIVVGALTIRTVLVPHVQQQNISTPDDDRFRSGRVRGTAAGREY